MNDLRKLARIILVGLGIYVLVKYGIGLFAGLPYLFYGESPLRGFAVVQLVSFVLVTVCLSLVIYALVWKADFWSAKIIDGDKPGRAEIWWLPFAFRLASVCAGILYLSWAISALVSIIGSYIQMMDPGFVFRPLPWHNVVGWVIQLGLGIYLLCGAPHFVRWQVKKTLEHCKRLEEPDSISDQEAGV
jgi:hypothetical protein